MGASASTAVLNPTTFLTPQVGRGPTVITGLTDENASWLMLESSTPWFSSKSTSADVVSLKAGDGTHILSFTAAELGDLSVPTLFRDAYGGLMAILRRGGSVKTYQMGSQEPCEPAVLYSMHPRVQGQEPSTEVEGRPMYAWSAIRLVSLGGGPKVLATAGIGSYPHTVDGFSSEPELAMRLHGRGGGYGHNQKAVDGSNENHGLAIVSGEGKTFTFTSGVDLVVVLAAHIELTTHQRLRGKSKS